MTKEGVSTMDKRCGTMVR